MNLGKCPGNGQFLSDFFMQIFFFAKLFGKLVVYLVNDRGLLELIFISFHIFIWLHL